MVCILLVAVDSAGNVPESAAPRAVAEWLKRGQCGHQEFEADWLKLADSGPTPSPEPLSRTPIQLMPDFQSSKSARSPANSGFLQELAAAWNKPALQQASLASFKVSSISACEMR